ncbi:MAG: hypothetical protein KatS3mg110_1550 [Pirellulaceae bacterium]|nr:MAG: hypothetical protein KatS3mg110_1550 [Pirellulaceae bacterium]
MKAHRCRLGRHYPSKNVFPGCSWVGLLGAIMIGCGGSLDAQQVIVTVPQVVASESYFENSGFGWQILGPGFFLQRGFSPAVVVPGPMPGGVHFGWGGSIGPVRYRAHFFAQQSFQRTYTASAATLTVTNGYSGYLFHGAYRPFIIQWIPLASLPANGESNAISQQPNDRSAVPHVAELPAGPAGVDDDPPVQIERIPPRDDPPLVLGKPAH